jgi:hypothetical protein
VAFFTSIGNPFKNGSNKCVKANITLKIIKRPKRAIPCEIYKHPKILKIE